MPTLHIMLNDDLEWSRGKRAAHAIHAALYTLGVRYTTPVRVLNANTAEAQELPITVTEHGTDDVIVAASNIPLREALVVRTVNRKRDTRDDTARNAVRAALAAYALPDHDIVIESCDRAAFNNPFLRVICDAGKTELEPGTVTAAALLKDS